MIHVRAPATTANLGAGFDCAGAALDLWNELQLVEGDGEAEPDHLAVRAFARLASPDGFSFAFTERIPRARGLGSSAATIALGEPVRRGEGVVERAFNLDEPRAGRAHLGELRARRSACRVHDDRLYPCPRCVRCRRRCGIPGRRADDRARTGLDCLRDGDGHTTVLE